VSAPHGGATGPAPGLVAGDLVGFGGRVAVVTGGGSSADVVPGVGEAICRTLAGHGAEVVVVDREIARAEETVAAVSREGGKAHAAACDVGVDKSCTEFVGWLHERRLRPEVLVNNVGIYGPRGSFRDTPTDDFNATYDVNVTSILRLAQLLLDDLARNGSGSVVNVSSVAGLRGVGSDVAYSVSKGAVLSATQSLAVELGSSGVRMNAVVPGYIYTPMVTRNGMTPEERAHRCRLAPLGTEGTGWDVAAAVSFLASDASRWITGAVLPVDGGILAVANWGGISRGPE